MVSHQSAAMCEPFHVELLPGYVVSRVFVRGRLDPIYVFPVRLGTERPSGTVITDWSLELPWPDSSIIWDHLPWDVIPPKYHNEYESLFKSPLMKVLNERRRILCGYPVDGLLCATSFQPIAESCHGIIPAKLSFTDDRGNTVPLSIDLDLYRLRNSSANRLPASGGAGQRLRTHLVDSGRRSVFAREIEALVLEEQVQGAEAIGVGSALETSKSEWGGRAIPTGPGSESGSLRGDAATRQSS